MNSSIKNKRQLQPVCYQSIMLGQQPCLCCHGYKWERKEDVNLVALCVNEVSAITQGLSFPTYPHSASSSNQPASSPLYFSDNIHPSKLSFIYSMSLCNKLALFFSQKTLLFSYLVWIRDPSKLHLNWILFVCICRFGTSWVQNWS